MMNIRYKVLLFLFICTAFVSCIDDDLQICGDDNEIPEMFTDGYSLNMIVTLDEMGGTRAEGTDSRAEKLKELESYIDPEKFRVLFFDRQERFLFESKSRWVKKIVPNNENDHSEWFVAVPIYAFGNDENEDWKWDEIRRVLTGEDMKDDLDNYPVKKDLSYKYNYAEEVIQKVKNGELQHAFKIAILANRPKKEWNMGITAKDADGKVIDGMELTEGEWTIYNGPNWTSAHTRWGDPNKMKKVFDLHHCQYDPVYDGKSYNDRGGVKDPPEDDKDSYKLFGKGSTKLYYKDYKVYDFIAEEVGPDDGEDEKIFGKPKMGASSTWIDWSYRDGQDIDPKTGTKNSNKGVGDYRYFVPPTEEHPIPMYGIQNFNELENWVKGTPFNLSRVTDDQENDYVYKPISLLRSVVRLELALPSSWNDIEWVVMFYPNVYARCEPLNVWDPTNEIWDESDTEHRYNDTQSGCEWDFIREYGAVTRNTEMNEYAANDVSNFGKSAERYKERMSWFYKAWADNGPDGNSRWTKLKLSGGGYGSQGSSAGTVPSKYPQIFNSYVQRVTAGVCYDGDREGKKGKETMWFDEGGKRHYVVYVGERNINDPSNIMRMGNWTGGAPTVCYWQVKRRGGNRYTIALAYHEENSGKTYLSYKSDDTATPSASMGPPKTDKPASPTSYEQAVQWKNAAMPWPLLRNHVYKITVDGTRAAGDGGLSIKSEDLYSKSIKFDRLKKEKKETEKKNIEKK